MPLVKIQKLLQDAQRGGYAVGAFNVENTHMIEAVIEAAEELSAPVILQTTPSTIRHRSLKQFYSDVKVMAEEATVPVVIHLDHGNSFELAMQAIREGYTSIMIDGSQKAFEANVELTKKVVEVAKASNIPVEAELGKVGGKEDELVVKQAIYTDPKEAVEFVKLTGIDALAVAIGTAHGVYIGKPKLDMERLSEIRECIDVPLVLHGASGLKNETIKECIQRGICKVNFATELRIAFSDGVKDTLVNAPHTYDPKVYLAEGKGKVKDLVKDRIRVCGCEGKYIR